MNTIAVTGSSGFVGRNLVKALDNQGYNVFKIDLLEGWDVTNWNQIRELPPFDVIVHLAAKSYVPDSFKHPQLFYSVNISSTLNVLELARINNSRVIYFSSYLYGEPDYLPVDETHPIKPHNPYAQSKVACEKICEGYYRDFGVPITIFRPFNIYGPGQGSSFLLPSIVQQLYKGEIILNDPRPKRDFVHINDIIRAVISGIHYDKQSLEIFNLGSGQSYSVEEIVGLMAGNITPRPRVHYTHEYRKGEILNSVADISKAGELLNWFPIITINEGLLSIL